jgi:hypothetical protein
MDTLVVFLLAVANTGTAALVYQYTDASRLAATLIASIVWIAFGVYVLSEKKKTQTGYDRLAGVLAIRMEEDMRPSNIQTDVLKGTQVDCRANTTEKKETGIPRKIKKCIQEEYDKIEEITREKRNNAIQSQKRLEANMKRSEAAKNRARGKNGKFV